MECSSGFLLGMVVHAFNLRTQKPEAGGPYLIQSQPGLYSELQDNQGCIDPVSKEKKKKRVASPAFLQRRWQLAWRTGRQLLSSGPLHSLAGLALAYKQPRVASAHLVAPTSETCSEAHGVSMPMAKPVCASPCAG